LEDNKNLSFFNKQLHECLDKPINSELEFFSQQSLSGYHLFGLVNWSADLSW